MCSTSLASPTLFLPIFVGGEEGKVALVSTTCAGTKIVALQSDCRIVNYAHSSTTYSMRPSLFCVVSHGRSSDKECVSELQFRGKTRADEREF